MFIDSHCHLTFPELKAQLTPIREAMEAAGVDRALCICTTLEEAPQVVALAQQYDNFWATVGVHPDNEGVSEPDVDALVALAGAPKVVAIGETGLDYYRLGDRTLDQMEWQRQRFRVHIRAARQARLPLVIHTRSAAQDTLALLVEEGAQEVGGVFHCFTEGVADMAELTRRGGWGSFTGVLTDKSAENVRAAAKAQGLARLMMETDAPYLTPFPHRGKPNEPAYVRHIAEFAAKDVFGVGYDELVAITTANARRFFQWSP
jgi:TatD DNase family protein